MMAGRCKTWIGQCRNMEILRKIGTHDLLFKNLVEQCLVTWPQNDVVMTQVGVILAAFITEINHHQRHGLLPELDQCIAVYPPLRFVDQLQIGRRIISVGYHDIRSNFFSTCQSNTLGNALVHQNTFDWRVDSQRAAHLFELGDKRGYQCPGATLGIMNTPSFFDKMDHGINGRHLHRIAADKQWLKAENLTHFV